MRYPDRPEIIPNRCDPLVSDAACAALTIADCLNIGLSPITIKCNEAWKPLLERMGTRFGYCWEWVSTDSFPQSTEHYARFGEAVLTKVG